MKTGSCFTELLVLMGHLTPDCSRVVQVGPSCPLPPALTYPCALCTSKAFELESLLQVELHSHFIQGSMTTRCDCNKIPTGLYVHATEETWTELYLVLSDLACCVFVCSC